MRIDIREKVNRDKKIIWTNNSHCRNRYCETTSHALLRPDDSVRSNKAIQKRYRLVDLFLLALFILFVCSKTYAYNFNSSYTFSNNETQQNKKTNETYYEKLIKKYKDDKKYIDKVYNKYSAYVIDLAEEYGIAPIIAMSQIKDQYEFAALAVNPDLFMDLYKRLTRIDNIEKRAKNALKLANAFLLADSKEANWKDNFAKLINSCSQIDLTHPQNGKSKIDIAKKKLKETVPINYLNEIRKDEKKYNLLLCELSEQNPDIIETIIRYPNSISFLLNTGKAGLKLLNKCPEVVIALSFILTLDEQKKLIDNCNKHPKILEAIKYCGIESYFTIMRCPTFYEKLVSKLNGEMAGRYVLAYAYLVRQDSSEMKSENIDNMNYIVSNFEDNTSELDGITSDLSKLLVFNINDNERFGGFAPFSDKWNLIFLYKYRQKAVNLTQKYGHLTEVATLFMNDWDGANQDIETLFETIDRFGDYGIQAILEFRYNKSMQEKILKDCEDKDRRSDLLMLLFYNNFMNGSLTSQYKSGLTSKAINGILNDYIVEDFTGLPRNKDKTSLIEFIPGYDPWHTFYEYAVHDKSPTLGDYVFSVIDIAQLIPFFTAAGTVVGELSRKGVKGLKALKSGTKSIVESTKNLALKSGKASVEELTDLAKKESKKSIMNLCKSSIQKPKFNDLKSYYSYIEKIAGSSKICIKNILQNEIKNLKDLYKNSEKFRKAVDKIMYGSIDDFVTEPVLFYSGVSSLEDYLESRKD